MSTSTKKVITFAAGPAKIPEEVLLKAQSEFMDFDKCGHSILEMSHRSPEFTAINNKAESMVRELLNVPDNYRILFLQGGGSGQFAAIPLNLIGLRPAHKADYVVTGSWSAKAAKEAEKYGTIRQVLPKLDEHTHVPDLSDWSVDPEASYLFYCDNETIHGLEFPSPPLPVLPPGVELVCDMSSNIMSRQIDVAHYGMIFAGAQKNIGCAGVTVVIVREDLLNAALPITPIVFHYKTQNGLNSLYNTPVTFSIYILGMVMEWIQKEGGVEAMSERSKLKAEMLYGLIESSNGFYKCPVDPWYRSRMNVVFRINNGDENLERRFASESHQEGLLQLKGHRSVGGLRASIYNAVSIEDVRHLVHFMKRFQEKVQKSVV